MTQRSKPSELVTRSAPPLVQRVRCLHCSTQRMNPGLACSTCGGSDWKSVKPGRADLEAIALEQIEAAEALDYALQAGQTIDKRHPNAERLRQACRAFALAQIGVLVR